MLAIFGLTLAVIVGVGAVLTAVKAPTRHTACQPFQPCGVPTPARPLVALSVFRSASSAFSLEYDRSLFSVAHQDGAGVTLGTQFRDGTSGLVDVHATRGGSASAAIADRVGGLRATISQLARDNDPSDQLLGAGVGLHSGGGAVYKGDLASPQGVSQSVVIAIESATDGRETLTAVVLAAPSDSGPQSPLYTLADQVINSVRWPAGATGK
jgi:hypothetical protein